MIQGGSVGGEGVSSPQEVSSGVKGQFEALMFLCIVDFSWYRVELGCTISRKGHTYGMCALIV